MFGNSNGVNFKLTKAKASNAALATSPDEIIFFITVIV
jgi:hypothetical protein